MELEAFEELKKQCKAGDVCVTNARGFWEAAPKNTSLWQNVGEHIVVKEKDVQILKSILANKEILIEFAYREDAIRFPIKSEEFISSYSGNCFYFSLGNDTLFSPTVCINR